MKNLFALTLLISILSLAAKAQIQKGALLTGGSISFSSGYDSNEQTINGGLVLNESDNDFLLLRPQIGIFVKESLLLGMGIQYEYRYWRNGTSIDGVPGALSSLKSNLIFVNPYVRKFYRLTDNFFFSPTLNILLGGGSSKQRSAEEIENDIFTLRANITPGLTYFISEKWAVSTVFGQLFYDRTRAEREPGPDDPGKTESISRDYGFNLSFNSFGISVQYFLRNNPE